MLASTVLTIRRSPRRRRQASQVPHKGPSAVFLKKDHVPRLCRQGADLFSLQEGQECLDREGQKIVVRSGKDVQLSRDASMTIDAKQTVKFKGALTT